MKLERGFTLLELIVAVALLAVLAAVALRGLGSVLDAETHSRGESRRWTEAAALMTQIGHDLSLAMETPSAGAGGELMIARRGDGTAPPLQVAPHRVGYRLRDNQLEHLHWSSPGAPALVSVVLEDVTRLEARALTADGTWRPLNDAPAAARAVEVQIALAGGERISRLYLLR